MYRSIRWNKRRIIIIFGVSLAIFLFWASRYNKYEQDFVIKNVKPERVWEFVADFSKMKLLNPTILDFHITADHGNLDHWKYSVTYREKLSHWPYSLNVADGHYSVRQDDEFHLVESTHRTCFLAGLYCVNSLSTFKFKAINGKDTYCLESVHYQCPPFLSSFCRREVVYQREAIMTNLNLHFSKKNHSV